MAQTIEFNITGMTCDHCVHAVTTAASEVDGVSDVVVSLEEKSAKVTGEDSNRFPRISTANEPATRSVRRDFATSDFTLLRNAAKAFDSRASIA